MCILMAIPFLGVLLFPNMAKTRLIGAILRMLARQKLELMWNKTVKKLLKDKAKGKPGQIDF